MNTIMHNSELNSLETDFEEHSARDLVDLLLENDVKSYRKFLPEIRKLDSNSFKNMFYGNKNYNYNIKNKFQFSQLLNKFENFKFLLEEWYEENDKYIYIKELWEKYISIESLRDKEENEIINFLSEKKIQYISWPQIIKEQFLKIIQNTKDTIIYACKQSFQKLPELMKNLLNKLYSVSEYCRKNGKEILAKLSKNIIFKIPKERLNFNSKTIAFLSDTIMDLISNGGKVINLVLGNGASIIDLFQEDFSNLLNGDYSPSLGSIMYIITSFVGFCYSIKSYTDTKKELAKVKELEEILEIIEKDFKEHIKRIKNLSENNTLEIDGYNLELENCVKLIREDKEKIIKLIVEIKAFIKEKNKQKKDLAINMVESGVKTVLGIAYVAMGREVSCAVNGIGALFNGASIIMDAINLAQLNDIINNLKKILNRAKEVESKIDFQLKNLQQKIKENVESAPSFC